jgi:hypothetical protein
MTPRNLSRRSSGPLVVAVAVLAVAALLTACTGSGGDTDRQGPAPGPRQGQTQGQPPTSVRGDLVGLVLTNAALTREGGGVTLRFTIANQGEDTVTIGGLLSPNGLKVGPPYDASGVYLYDGNARKRYDVARDGDACRCAKVPLGIDPAQSLELFATFPDPGQPGELSAIVPHFAPLDGLRIQG